MSEYRRLAEEKEQERIMLQYELDDLMAAHDSIKMEYGTLADSLSLKDSIIQANAAEIKELLNYKWEYNKVNKKLNQLREITQGYVHQMDSLYTVNRELKEENEKIRQQYNREQDRTRELTRDKEQLIEKVSEATVLRAYNVTALTMRFTGSGRDRLTDKARKVERVEVCFTLGENKLTEPGIKVIYIQIIRPDGVVVTQKVGEDYSFDTDSGKKQYTAKKEVDYQNKDAYACLHWDKKTDTEAAMIGIYDVKVFYDGEEIGSTSFELK
jgi:DNA repair ATPase RecN